MITAQESLLLELIDSVEDKGQQRSLIEKVIASTKEKKLKPKMEAIVNPSYTMIEVLDRMKKDKPVSLQDLHGEINKLKTETIQLKMRIEILELIDGNKDNSDKEEEELKLFENSYKEECNDYKIS